MSRTPAAILLVALLVTRAVFGMDFTASVWCGGEAHGHPVGIESPCAHDCEHEKPLFRPVPVDLHEQDCGCESGEQFGGEVFTVVSSDSDLVIAAESNIGAWEYQPVLDLRVASFRGPPRVIPLDDRPRIGRLVILLSDRLNI